MIYLARPLHQSKNKIAFGSNSELLQKKQPINIFNLKETGLEKLTQPLNGFDTPIAFDRYRENMLIKNIQPNMNYLEKIYISNNEEKTRFPIESDNLIIYANWWY